MNQEYPKPFGDGEISIRSLSRRGQLPVRMVGTRIPAYDGRAVPVLAARGQERRDVADLS